MKRALVAGRRMLLVIGLLAAGVPSSAHAGSYSVVGGCGNWTPISFGGDEIAMHGDCSTLIVWQVAGPFNSAFGELAYWQFTPPSGTLVGGVSMSGGLIGRMGWEASVTAANGVALARCPGVGCSGGSTLFSLSERSLATDVLNIAVACLRMPTCPNDKGVNGYAAASKIAVQILDSTVPAVAITGGTLLTGWRRGGGSLSLRASDNVGIKQDRLLVDGVPREQRARSCRWGARIPCPNGAATLTLDTTRVLDGPHAVTVQAVDSAGNVGGTAVGIRVDNTAPTAPLATSVDGGSAWRAAGHFALRWVNPAQTYAPIAAVRYRLCRLSNLSTDMRGCVERVVSAPDIHELSDVQPPGAGAWRARLSLIDAAGNENAAAAAETVLRFDDSAPTVVFHKPVPTDPARVRVSARDAVSSLTSVAIEARRRGDSSWTALAPERREGDYAAFVDDERLARGTYDLRARAVDAAGNERTGTTGDDGRPAVLTLPVRQRASLTAGIRTRTCFRRSRCSPLLVHDPLLDFGRPAALTGRLVVGGRGASQPIEVWRRVKVPGAAWQHITTVRSSRSGGFRYAVSGGPARLLRFRFAGTPTARGATAFVNARVRAATTIDVNRRNAVNGEYVTFRGRVRGGHIPAGGKLVELQVFTRRLWRTFAVPRADARSGRWRFMYRFETISGRARFRFRARVPSEAGYPFHTGTSRQLAVTVQGI